MIDGQVLQKAGIDYDAGIRRFMNDLSLYEAVLTAFINEDLMERIEVAYNANDRETLAKIAHEAKGSCGNVGLDMVYVAANEIVQLLRKPSYTDDEFEAAYTRFKSAYITVRNTVKSALI